MKKLTLLGIAAALAAISSTAALAAATADTVSASSSTDSAGAVWTRSTDPAKCSFQATSDQKVEVVVTSSNVVDLCFPEPLITMHGKPIMLSLVKNEHLPQVVFISTSTFAYDFQTVKDFANLIAYGKSGQRYEVTITLESKSPRGSATLPRLPLAANQ